MPLPPLTKDYVTIGGTQPNSDGFSYWTWAQVRTPVTAAQHATGGFSWGSGNFHARDYVNPIYGIDAVDSQNRLFRGIPNSAIGYNDWTTPSGSGVDQRFFFGTFYESPFGSGIFIPGVGVGLDKEEEGPILLSSVFVGSGGSVTVSSDAYDGSDPDGQNIGSTTLGTVSSVTLSF